MDENQNDGRGARCPICGGKSRVKVCEDAYPLYYLYQTGILFFINRAIPNGMTRFLF